jgi:hypothetical protein
MADSEDSSQLEFVKTYRKLRSRLHKIYQEYPPIYKGQVKVWPDWTHDGCDMSPRWVDVWEFPSNSVVDSFLKAERNKVPKDLFGEPPVYIGPDLAELGGK